MKKRMFLSTILMTLVLLLAVTTATFAWYKASSGSLTLTEQAPTGALYVKDNSVELGDVSVTVSWSNQLPNDVNYTDTTGKSYYYAGKVDADHKLEVANPKATSTVGFTLTLVGDTASLQALSGTYVITFTASGELKIGVTEEAAIAVDTAGSTATHEFTIGNAGTITEGASGSIIFGFIGKDVLQTGAGGRISATTVAPKS